MIIAYLIFAHLLADFVLQPGKLVKWKMSSKAGTFVHVLVHFFMNLLILYPFINNGHKELILVTIGICVTHFFIDETKIHYDKKHKDHVRPFIMDQIAHLLTIVLAYFFIKDIAFALPETTFARYYGNILIILFLSAVIFLTKVVDIYRFQIAREKSRSAKLREPRKEQILRISVFSALYLTLLLLIAFANGGIN